MCRICLLRLLMGKTHFKSTSFMKNQCLLTSFMKINTSKSTILSIIVSTSKILSKSLLSLPLYKQKSNPIKHLHDGDVFALDIWCDMFLHSMTWDKPIDCRIFCVSPKPINYEAYLSYVNFSGHSCSLSVGQLYVLFVFYLCVLHFLQ